MKEITELINALGEELQKCFKECNLSDGLINERLDNFIPDVTDAEKLSGMAETFLGFSRERELHQLNDPASL